jgi:regulator of nucleoside diphosphate kinase
MALRNIYLTEPDLVRLRGLVEARIGFNERDRDSLESLQGQLDHAEVVAPTAIPRYVVTMNSTVRLKNLETAAEESYTITFPSEADVTRRTISVLAPMGTAVLGCQVGDAVEWNVPGGLKRWRIQEVLYQPEASGHYHL